jgi:hypothetical protein
MIATETLAPPTEGVFTRLRQLLDRIADLEFTSPLGFAALSVAYLASRVPWLDRGYGTDPDAWRVALVADKLRETGDYYPSRLPGYPLHEFVTAGIGFVGDGWIWTNLSTVLASLAGVYLFALLAKQLDLPNRGVLTLGFAFAPLLWINSVMTMDYMWALTAMLGAYLLLLHRQNQFAGLALGVAAGFRLTSLFLLPVFWLYLWRTKQRAQVRHMTFAALAVTLGAYTLVLMDYGLNFLNFFDQKVYYEEFIKRLAKDGLGVIGVLALAGALALSHRQLRSFPRDLLRNTDVLVWTLSIVVFVFSYTRLPHEIAYLIPLFPFGFFLMARYMSRAVLCGCLAVIVLAGFVDITSTDDAIGFGAGTFTSARIGEGMLLSDLETLDNQMDFAREVRRLTADHPDIEKPAVVMVGFIYPELVMLYRDELDIGLIERDYEAISQLSDKGRACEGTCDGSAQLEYVWLLDYDTFQEYKREGRTVYVTPDAERSTYAVYGYRPAYFGAILLPLSRENPSLGKGTASTDR